MELTFKFNKRHQLEMYGYEFRNKVKDLCFFTYDSLNRISMVQIRRPIDENLLFEYSDTSKYFTNVTSSLYGQLGIEYTADHLLHAVLIGDCKIVYGYNNFGDVTSLNDPCEIKKKSNVLLDEINFYYGQSIDYRYIDTCDIYKIDYFTTKKKFRTAVYPACSDNFVDKIVSKGDLSTSFYNYPSCTDCDSITSRINLNVWTDLSRVTYSNTPLIWVNLEWREFFHNPCFTKLTMFNHSDFNFSISPTDLNKPTLAILPNNISDLQRQSIYQRSYIYAGVKINLLKLVDKRFQYELNFDEEYSLSAIRDVTNNSRRLFQSLSFCPEFNWQLFSKSGVKVDLSIAAFYQIHPGFNNTIGGDQYFVPALKVSAWHDRLSFKYAYYQNINTYNFYKLSAGLTLNYDAIESSISETIRYLKKSFGF